MKQLIITHTSVFMKTILVFFSPIKPIILLVGLSTILDTIAGIWRAKKLKEKVSSRKARKGLVPKLVSYIVAVLLVYTTDFFIINELVSNFISIDYLATKLIALALISVEVKSIDESFKAVKGCSFLEKITSIILKARDIRKNLR
ncbi:MAG: hypothetical protein Unbinned3907contig1000_15 [Prokaryotic dsDNA virus sp.]|nr:MAG: hypothetical protein Unbinned3907contig1000_15 [Prokaryotic dsDNA virus sp.]|tara:strand:- start:1070 stop:1504 length:435 start_codon:yes stop_codon:yes gene_type:complete